ncbi:hypothetical protein BOX15_Mlig003296g2, partial [Macrostomum lignano]
DSAAQQLRHRSQICLNCSVSRDCQLCGRCRNASYCCRACQVAHWSSHRSECARLAKLVGWARFMTHLAACLDPIDSYRVQDADLGDKGWAGQLGHPIWPGLVLGHFIMCSGCDAPTTNRKHSQHLVFQVCDPMDAGGADDSRCWLTILVRMQSSPSSLSQSETAANLPRLCQPPLASLQQLLGRHAAIRLRHVTLTSDWPNRPRLCSAVFEPASSVDAGSCCIVVEPDC